jgi:hypothetical protein
MSFSKGMPPENLSPLLTAISTNAGEMSIAYTTLPYCSPAMIWDPRIKELLTKYRQHRENQRILENCLHLLGGILIAARDASALSPK